MIKNDEIENLSEIKNQLEFLNLDKQIIESEIFEKIAVEVYNGLTGINRINEINEIINFLIEILPVYSKIYGKNFVETLEILASVKNCNYINWFQSTNITKNFSEILIFKNADDFFEKYPEKKYICPKCGGHSTNAYERNAGCDWKVYGLFGDLGKGCYLFFTDKIQENPIPQNIFRPMNFSVQK